MIFSQVAWYSRPDVNSASETVASGSPLLALHTVSNGKDVDVLSCDSLLHVRVAFVVAFCGDILLICK